ncbi:MAG: rhomboid family intramembrane serine protease [Candidatus Glassbacteria bacterium]|nr:rhomboid family intramembrane serine protease [Candidatus Glassbacteria bacterium]
MIPFKDDVPTRTRPVVTVTLIVINCLVFLFQLSMPAESHQVLVQAFGVVPSRMTRVSSYLAAGLHNPLVSVLTAMFLHGGWLHLLGNMLYLWIFGNNVEDSMGHVRFIFFYLVCGLAATTAQVAAEPGSAAPMIGASGAIAGVLGAYLILHPFARVHTLLIIFIFIRVITLPAIVVLSFWFLIQLFSSLGPSGPHGGVAWHAHIGGFVCGLLLIRFFQKSHRSRPGYRWL